MKLNLYRVDDKYCDYLRTFDKRVPFLMDEKKRRPFVGIVLNINNNHFFAPLTSPKQKHLSMKNQVDFIKIDEGKLGAINLNNMIPVLGNKCYKIQINDMPTLTKAQEDYKELIKNQLDWCNKNKENICNKAMKLYDIVCLKHAQPNLLKRCCSFKLLEVKYIEYGKYLSNANRHQLEDEEEMEL